MPRRLHIIGRKNSGKTTLIVELVKCLTARQVSVGTIKHTHHRHELDVPGKDSYQHREAGAAVVGILSPGMTAVFVPTGSAERHEARYHTFEPHFAHCDVVLVEGDSLTTAPKIEVWRAATGTEPMATTDRNILAIVTNDPPPLDRPTLARSEVSLIADWILNYLR